MIRPLHIKKAKEFLGKYYKNIKDDELEEKVEALRTFLNKGQSYQTETNSDFVDLLSALGFNNKYILGKYSYRKGGTTLGEADILVKSEDNDTLAIFEVKSLSSSGMISTKKLNHMAMREAILYFVNEVTQIASSKKGLKIA